MSGEYIIPTIARLIIPISILRYPLIGILFAALLDWKDWDFLGVSTDKEMIFYQNWDKVMDLFYLGLAWWTSLSWKDQVAKITSSTLFFIRLAGVPAAFFLDRGLLLLFPNIFEWFFIFYLLFVTLTKKTKLFTSRIVFILVLSSITIPKLAQEYFMHVRKEFPWVLFDFYNDWGLNTFLPEGIHWSMWIWVFLFGILPILTLVWVIKFPIKKKS
jgi:hypothetical protein